MSTRIPIIIFCLIIIAVFASASLDWLRSVGRLAVRPAEPLAAATAQSRGFFASLRDVGQLRQTIADLQVRNAELEAEVTTLKESISRGGRFEAELGAASLFAPDRLLPARVIARSPLGVLDELIVNQGSKRGVAVGQPVLKSGFLLGVVHQVSSSTSTVTLLTSAQTTLPVVLQESRGQGLLKGGLDGLLVTDLPIDVTIKPGERVLTSALGDLLPADIPVGQVGSQVSRESEILKRVTLSSPIRFSDAEAVVIVTNSKGAQ